MSDKIFKFLEGVIVTAIAAAVGAAVFGLLMYVLITIFDPHMHEGPSPLDRALVFATTFGAVGGAFSVSEAQSKDTPYLVGNGIVFLVLLVWGLFALFYADGWLQVFHGAVGALANPIILGWGALVAGIGTLLRKRKRR